MSLALFALFSISFLLFVSHFVLSPERNPHFEKIKGEVDEGTIEALSNVLIGIAVLFAICLVAAVPFFRLVVTFAMLFFVARFFFRQLKAKRDSRDTDGDPLSILREAGGEPGVADTETSPLERAGFDALGRAPTDDGSGPR